MVAEESDGTLGLVVSDNTVGLLRPVDTLGEEIDEKIPEGVVKLVEMLGE